MVGAVRVGCKQFTGTALQYVGNNYLEVKEFLHQANDVHIGSSGDIFVMCPVTGKTGRAQISFWVVLWDHDCSMTMFSPGSFSHQMTIIPDDALVSPESWVRQARAAGWLSPVEVQQAQDLAFRRGMVHCNRDHRRQFTYPARAMVGADDPWDPAVG